MIAFLLALLLVPAAHAWVPPGATVVSASSTLREQGDDSSASPALSGDGRYVAFRTSARNLFPPDVVDPPGRFYGGGVFRRDLTTGALELVALGDLREGDGAVTRGAENPSISADGRWVAFSTAQALVALDTNTDTDIYVRDMDRPRDDPAAYELISARDGSDQPAGGASEVTTAAALSADGQRVVFRTVEQDATTPPYQVWVRDRATRTTRLVTHLRGDRTAAAGGALGQAGISADGSTVVWTGRNAGAQVQTVPGESLDPNAFSYLWQRVGEETRRIAAATDPDDPACTDYVPSDVATGPCYGPLADIEQGLTGILTFLPALSADGRHVAFLTSTSPRPRVTGSNVDLFLTDMSPGVTRKAGTVELTRDDPVDPTAGAPLGGVALSGDGRFAAFVTSRLRFTLPALRLITPVRSVFGTDELYLVDLAAHTVERAVRGADGSDANGTGVIAQLSMSEDGHRIAFASGADNLFFGDANQRTDVFVVDRLDAAPPPADADEVPVDPPLESLEAPTTPSRKLQVSVRRAPSYVVRLQVKAPVKGTLRVEVRGRVPDSDGRPRGTARLLGTRTLTLKNAGSVRVDVKLTKRFRTAARRAGAIAASAAATLTPTSGASSFQRTITVRFQAPK